MGGRAVVGVSGAGFVDVRSVLLGSEAVGVVKGTLIVCGVAGVLGS